MSQFVQMNEKFGLEDRPFPPPARQEILDQARLYKQIAGESDNDDGREEEARDYVLSTIESQPASAKSSEAVLAAIDEYACTHQFLMTIGSAKRTLITSHYQSLLSSPESQKPTIIVELGSYVGYTAIFLGGLLRDTIWAGKPPPEARVYSIDLDERWANITKQMIRLAGLQDIVEVVVGEAGKTLRQLAEKKTLKKGDVDMFLIDHWEKYYVEDLKIATEELHLLKKGTVVAADNVVFPGTPDYIEFLKEREGNGIDGWAYENEIIESMMPNGWADSLMISTVTNAP